MKKKLSTLIVLTLFTLLLYTEQPVLDASVNVDMMLMDVGSHSSMPGMDGSSETTLKGQAKLDNMEPGMYSITLTPTEQRRLDPGYSR